jgi:hypothetical protein
MPHPRRRDGLFCPAERVQRGIIAACGFVVHTVGYAALLYATPIYWKQKYHTSALTVDMTPRRKQKAIDWAQKLEKSWLTTKQMVQLISIFKVSTEAVDAYMSIFDEEIRKGWVEGELGIDY